MRCRHTGAGLASLCGRRGGCPTHLRRVSAPGQRGSARGRPAEHRLCLLGAPARVPLVRRPESSPSGRPNPTGVVAVDAPVVPGSIWPVDDLAVRMANASC